MNPDYDGCQENKAERERRDLYGVESKVCRLCGHEQWKQQNGRLLKICVKHDDDCYCPCEFESPVEVKCTKCGHPRPHPKADYCAAWATCPCRCVFPPVEGVAADNQLPSGATYSVCPACKGSGQGRGDVTYCGMCGGDGTIELTGGAEQESGESVNEAKTSAIPAGKVVKDNQVSADLAAVVDDALVYCNSGEGRGIAAQESKLSAICRTNDCQWLNVKDFPPPERHLLLLHGPLGKYGIGFFENGEQREQYHAADWEAGYWMTLPCGPNTMHINYIDRAAQADHDSKTTDLPDESSLRPLPESVVEPLSAYLEDVSPAVPTADAQLSEEAKKSEQKDQEG